MIFGNTDLDRVIGIAAGATGQQTARQKFVGRQHGELSRLNRLCHAIDLS